MLSTGDDGYPAQIIHETLNLHVSLCHVHYYNLDLLGGTLC
jgi:hypothetical protein